VASAQELDGSLCEGWKRSSLMILRGVTLAVLAGAIAAANGLANIATPSEPVLRLRLPDPSLQRVQPPQLRLRLNDDAVIRSAGLSKPSIRQEQLGQVGRFAYIGLNHPNLVAAIGATEDRSEIGRQIDRALIAGGATGELYAKRHDAAPFIGIGVRSSQVSRGWSADATLGAELYNPPDTSRLSMAFPVDQVGARDLHARANVRVRYRF
jgi:hypothetical protein